jgi:hypothetical protein
VSESIFAPVVTEHTRRTTEAGAVFPERMVSDHATFPWQQLEDKAGFHEMCERLRVAMIGLLRREEHGPINRWRIGALHLHLRTRACHEDEK